MITFLPHDSYEESARCLDPKRLGCQRSEARMVAEHLLFGHHERWANHPVMAMWRGHEWHLLQYGIIVCREWDRRGYEDRLGSWFHNHQWTMRRGEEPPWMGDSRLHRSHQSNLIRKLPEWYREQFPWMRRDDIPYFWPVQDGIEA